MSLNAPRPRMPSLNSLRAFEAAARHESFASAGEELGVTPGAVAQQVKALEAWLGVELFDRLSQGIRLREEAKAVLGDLSGAFDALGNAVAGLRTSTGSPFLRIAALPSIAQLWLQPRLPRLSEKLEVYTPSVFALEEPPDFRREMFDLALFFVDGPVAGAKLYPLVEDTLTPVCSPKLLEWRSVPFVPGDVAGMPLLHDAMWNSDWDVWMKAAGLSIGMDSSGPTFSLYSLAVQAAVDGSGLLIGHSALLDRYLADERLMTPFDLEVPAPKKLCLLLPDRGKAAKPNERDQLLLDVFRSIAMAE